MVTPNLADIALAIRWKNLSYDLSCFGGYYKTVLDLLMSGF